jgi:hypothetical protein
MHVPRIEDLAGIDDSGRGSADLRNPASTSPSYMDAGARSRVAAGGVPFVE